MKAEHTEQLGTPALEIVFGNVVCVRRFMQSETICRALYYYYLCDILEAGMIRRGYGVNLPYIR